MKRRRSLIKFKKNNAIEISINKKNEINNKIGGRLRYLLITYSEK